LKNYKRLLSKHILSYFLTYN